MNIRLTTALRLDFVRSGQQCRFDLVYSRVIECRWAVDYPPLPSKRF